MALFPDLARDGGAFQRWTAKAGDLFHITDFNVSDYLERVATVEEKIKGLDLRDHLSRFGLQNFPSI